MQGRVGGAQREVLPRVWRPCAEAAKDTHSRRRRASRYGLCHLIILLIRLFLILLLFFLIIVILILISLLILLLILILLFLRGGRG